jgi:hypothetical protein
MSRDCPYTAEIKWDGGDSSSRVFEFANPSGDAVWLSPAEHNKLVFAIRKGTTVQQVSAPALRKGVWTVVQVTMDGQRATLYVDGKNAAENDGMTPDTRQRPGHPVLSRSRPQGWPLGGMIDRFTIHCVAVADPTP